MTNQSSANSFLLLQWMNARSTLVLFECLSQMQALYLRLGEVSQQMHIPLGNHHRTVSHIFLNLANG